MRWILIVLCGCLALYLKKKGPLARWLWGSLTLSMMAGQLFCLHASGLLSLQTALPLHLCSFSGILCLPALVTGQMGLKRFFCRFAWIGAALALIFPAQLPNKWAFFSDFCFFGLHALLLFSPLLLPPKKPSLWYQPGRREREERAEALGCLGLALLLIFLAGAADALFGANYLFLRALPGQAPGSLPGRMLALLLLAPALCFLPISSTAFRLLYHQPKRRRIS